MRVALILLVSTLLLASCKREAQEAAAQAKGAAADAQRAAKDAAAKAKGTADQAKTAADEAAAQARAAAEHARVAASGAGDSARRGLDGAGQSLREITAGNQLEGVLLSTAGTELSVRPASGSVQRLHTDDRTRWISHGTAGSKEGFGTGSSVRVTYIVQNGQNLATQVEAISR
jgi:hypothetical protein